MNICELAISWLSEKYDLISAGEMEGLLKTARSSGVDNHIVLSTGAVKSDRDRLTRRTQKQKPNDFCRITGK